MLFDIDGTFFVHLAWFLVLVILLNKWLFQPFFQVRSRWTETTKGRLEEARKKLEEARFAESLLQKELEEHRLAMSLKRQEARREFQQQADIMRREADRQAEAELAEAEAQIQFEAEKITAQLERHLPEYIEKLKNKALGGCA